MSKQTTRKPRKAYGSVPSLDICIREIPAPAQRYATLGDWAIDEAGRVNIFVTPDPKDGPHSAFLIALHELVEAYLCQVRGISQTSVDAFDMAYAGEGEPGDEPGAPYRKEHRFAMLVEHLMAHELGLIDYGAVT